MNRKELREYLNIHLNEYLSEKGFKIDAEVSLVKKTKTHDYKVFLLLNTYMTVMVRDIFPKIKFNDIESPLNKIYAFDQPDSEKKILLNSVCTVDGGHLATKPNLEIHDEGDVVQLANIIREYMDKIAIPFFEKYNDLLTINQEILANDMPYKEEVGYTGGMGDYYKVPIVGNGDNKMVERRMFIMKYCKDSRYKDFVKWYQNHLDIYEVDTEERIRKKLYKIFNDTKEYLSKLEIS